MTVVDWILNSPAEVGLGHVRPGHDMTSIVYFFAVLQCVGHTKLENVTIAGSN